MRCYWLIAGVAARHAGALSCMVLAVSRSGLHAGRRQERSGTPSARAKSGAALTERTVAMHRERCGTEGSPRFHAELRAARVCCSRQRVERLMRREGLRGRGRERRGVPRRVLIPAPRIACGERT